MELDSQHDGRQGYGCNNNNNEKRIRTLKNILATPMAIVVILRMLLCVFASYPQGEILTMTCKSNKIVYMKKVN
jgi:hypothetical protein